MAERETHTPHQNVRMDKAKWASFGKTTGLRGRSEWLNEFVDGVLDDPQLWLDIRAIARARALSFWAVVNLALSQYRTRNRHLLDAGSVPGAQLPQRPERREEG